MRLSERVVVLAVLGAVGCVGDSSSPIDAGTDSSTVGGLGQPCYADDTCNAGLRCQIISSTSNICVQANADAGTDSAVNDAGGSDASDAATNPCPAGGNKVHDCLTGTTSAACLGSSGFVCSPGMATCQTSQAQFTCGSTSQCPTSGQFCCLSQTEFTSSPGCNAVYVWNAMTNPAATCAASCNGATLCESDTDCVGTAQFCESAVIMAGGTMFPVGVCGN